MRTRAQDARAETVPFRPMAASRSLALLTTFVLSESEICDQAPISARDRPQPTHTPSGFSVQILLQGL